MDAKFWHDRWENNQIAFHEGRANPRLVEHFEALSLAEGSRVFLPLCGKTRDIPWLMSQGCRVAGVELSAIAVEQLFEDLGVAPSRADVGDFVRYSAEGLDVFVGDLFALSFERLGSVDAIYDRAALVALPEPMRRRYAAHLTTITGGAPQLLICYEYDQDALAGPPFSIEGDEVRGHYGQSHEVTLLARAEVPGGLKGQCAATESVWLLRAR